MTFGFIASERAIATRLLLASGEVARVHIGLLGDADALQLFPRDAVRLGLRSLADETLRQHHVLERGQVVEQVELLEHHPDLFAHRVDRRASWP